MSKRKSIWILAAALSCGACHKSDSHAERKGPLVVAEQPPLPEDPEQAKRASAQWDKHLQKEEDERQALFDRQRVAQHRSALKLLISARKALDEAMGAHELADAQQVVDKQLTDVRALVKELDPWGNSSRLLPDYDALLDLLGARYGAARQAAYGGDSRQLTAAGTEFDTHVRKMQGWLLRVVNEEEEENE